MIVYFPGQPFGLAHIADNDQTTRCGLFLAALQWANVPPDQIMKADRSRCPACGTPVEWKGYVERLNIRDHVIAGRVPRVQASRALITDLAILIGQQPGLETCVTHLPTGGSMISISAIRDGHKFTFRLK